jgi:hypothetical protein
MNGLLFRMDLVGFDLEGFFFEVFLAATVVRRLGRI